MKEIVTVVKRTSNNKYLVKKSTGVTQLLNTDRSLSRGDKVLLVNGNVAGVVYTGNQETVRV